MSATLDSIRRHLVGLKMPRALETLDHVLRQAERGTLTTLEAIDALLGEELALREARRVKAALQMGRLLTVKTLAGFDFAFQPSLDRDRILALAQLDFIDRHEVLHLLGQPGCGKTHLATALGVEAVKAGRSVYFTTLADLIASLAKAEREGTLRERLRFLCRPQLLIVDEIGYLPVVPGGGNLFFQLVNARAATDEVAHLLVDEMGQLRSSGFQPGGHKGLDYRRPHSPMPCVVGCYHGWIGRIVEGGVEALLLARSSAFPASEGPSGHP